MKTASTGTRFDAEAWRSEAYGLAAELHASGAPATGPAAVALAVLGRANEYVLDRLTGGLERVMESRVSLGRPPQESSQVELGQLLLMPVGDRCNLACTYCYETDRRETQPSVMTVETLESVMANVIPYVRRGLVINVHGGEPLLAGLPFLERLIELTRRTDLDVAIGMQTNATLVDAETAAWLKDHSVSVGVSIDGEQADHDELRVDRHGRGSWQQVIRGVEHLQQAGLDPGGIAVFGPSRAGRPSAPKRLIKALTGLGLRHLNVQPALSPTSHPSSNVDPLGYASFMTRLCDAWLEHGDPNVTIGTIDHIVHGLIGQLPGVCYFSGECKTIIGVHADGAVIPCTRPFETRHTFGNLATTPLPQVLASAPSADFAAEELAGRPSNSCRWSAICNGGCPHERMDEGAQAVDGRHVYCTCDEQAGGFPALFDHVAHRLIEALAGP